MMQQIKIFYLQDSLALLVMTLLSACMTLICSLLEYSRTNVLLLVTGIFAALCIFQGIILIIWKKKKKTISDRKGKDGNT